jgi:tRNA (adenine-N(1)-)-methyltransferase non-catalytic subunit
LDQPEENSKTSLRLVTAAELYAHIQNVDAPSLDEAEDGKASNGMDGVEYEVVNSEGGVVMRSNKNTIDDATSQKLTMNDIEALKKEETGSGRDLIAKILESHSALDQKTAFALAKYTLRKTKKYMKRFTVLPLDVTLLTNWLLYEKEPAKIMEIREEILALIGSWLNVHHRGTHQLGSTTDGTGLIGGGRWLVVDETGGLIVASMAERMGILYPTEADLDNSPTTPTEDTVDSSLAGNPPEHIESLGSKSTIKPMQPLPTETNTITLIHANSQPHLNLLSYFSFDSTNPQLSHPLYSRLKSLSWLQLLSPMEDSWYAEPEKVPDEALQTYKASKRGNYYRKRKRWERIKSIVDETRSGGFDGLVVASVMKPATILHHAIPLLRGAAQVVVYSPNIEPLAELADYYSTARRVAFQANPPENMPTEDFPVDPTLLLGPTIQTARCKPWQVLPGRTHPLMTGRGGAEGYVFTGTRVLPAEGKVEARGRYKRRKMGESSKVKEQVTAENITSSDVAPEVLLQAENLEGGGLNAPEEACMEV